MPSAATPVNAIVAQCGGPTPVINASLAAVVAACRESAAVERLWGCKLGMHGLVHGHWIDLTHLSDEQLERLRTQPGAALGSSRNRTRPGDFAILLKRLAAHNVGLLLLIGGNGTMAAAHAIAQEAEAGGYRVGGAPLRVVGIPKTIDNDLEGTDAAPGYASAARFVAETTRAIGLDLRAMVDYDQVAVLEVMGRHAGWLAAAAALARSAPGDPPHLILLPEVPFDEECFLARVQQIQRAQGVCLVVAGEGLRDPEGAFLAEKHQAAERDATGQRMLSLAAGVAPYLAQLVRSRLGLLCRQMRPDTIQRSCAALASPVDRTLAALTAGGAVAAALAGVSDVMVGVTRTAAGWEATPVPLAEIIGRERRVPPTMFHAETFDVTPEFLAYARPLLGELSPTPILF